MKNIHKINNNIYITSDEQVKEGDWFIQVNTKKRIKHHSKNGLLLQPQKFDKKIILTTDDQLIKDGVQAIDDKFLEWFVKNPSCETIEIIPSEFLADKVIYEIIIPQEESKQETTLEEAAQKYKDLKLPDDLYDGFIAGAKYQAERMYSEEDLILFYDFIENHQLRKYGDIWKRITNNPNDRPLDFESVDDKYVIEWFEQFSKLKNG